MYKLFLCFLLVLGILTELQTVVSAATGEQSERVWGEVGPEPRRRRLLRTKGESHDAPRGRSASYCDSPPLIVLILFFADRHSDQGRHRPLPPVRHHPAGLPASHPL